MTVSDTDTAISLRSGAVPVLGTPRLLALCEEAAGDAVDGQLEDGTTTVGMRVQLDHLAPSPVGCQVRAEATLKKVEGKRLTFNLAAHDERGLVAVGAMTRVIVDAASFVERCG